MPSALQMAEGDPRLCAAVQRCRRLLHQRALVAAAAGAVPVPGLDWAVDAALLSKLLPRISAEFGLAPYQLDQLDPEQREKVQKAVAMAGSVLIGKLVTRDVLLRAAHTVGVRLTAQQAAKYVPLAGTAVSAMLGYSAVRLLGEQHMKDCVRVARHSGLLTYAPAAEPVH